ncbi:permease [Macrococcoides canis]|uniref:permease n=1 Tax=Macrococcoides canis TaxID=1855823 RepID=UPI0020B6FF40|nr:permease [Macrococcus canis]UTG99805.1 permease [Macrococcus canis]UTH11272.1 permease [Macrococcus canis]
MSIELLTDIFGSFLSLSLNLLILFFLISIIISFFEPFIPFSKLEKIMTDRNMLLGNFAGALLGFITPFCSCSTIPLLVTMINRKIPFQIVMTYLFSSPLLDPWILGLMYYIYGFNVTAIYGIVTFLFSMLIGYVLDKLKFSKYVKNVIVEGVELHEDASRRTNIPLNIKVAFIDTLNLMKSVFTYIIFGALIGAIIKEAVPTSLLTALGDFNQWIVIPIAAIIGVPLYIRLSTMLPITNALLAGGFPLSPMMALLIGGAGASLPEVIMLKSIFHNRLVIAFVVSVFIMATFSGYLFLLLNFK